MNRQILQLNRRLKLPEGIELESKNLTAKVEFFPGTETGSRSYGQGLAGNMQDSANVFELGTITLHDLEEGRVQNQQVTMYAPSGTKTQGQLLLYADENGAVTFHKPQIETTHQGIRQYPLVRYDIPIRQPLLLPDQKAAARGIIGALGKKVLKLIGWEVVGKAVSKVGPPLVRKWESSHRPMRVLNWQQLFDSQASDHQALIPDSQRSLLFIHGTFSRVASAFKGLGQNQDFLDAIHDSYGEHIYGFDHATLATGVATNVMQLYHKLGAGTHNFDIICHSRGGLVARAFRDLDEKQLKDRFQDDAQRGQYEYDLKAWEQNWQIPDNVKVNINKILFVATPNNGTVLAQPTFLNKYLDVLMSATNILPDVADITVDALLVVAKLLLNDMMTTLPGLDDQQPESTLFELLCNSHRPLDAAIQANYDPPPGLQALMRLAEGSSDLIFGHKENDLVVPTEGVSRWSGNRVIDRCWSFKAQKRVHHCNIFESLGYSSGTPRKTQQRLLDWLLDWVNLPSPKTLLLSSPQTP